MHRQPPVGVDQRAAHRAAQPGLGGQFPQQRGPACDTTPRPSALTIDSLECTTTGVCNNSCVEPVNFAFIQTNGVPTGAPSPQLVNLNTMTPNQRTLLMNPGDKLQIRILDNKKAGALETSVRDLNSGRTGFSTASSQRRRAWPSSRARSGPTRTADLLS